MRIVVCVRKLPEGEASPFDGCAYEAALRIKGAEVILLSMASMSDLPFLEELTRLGASGGVLLSDEAFAGADTAATAYVLSNAIEKLTPDLILCGRCTLIGDTAQTGPMTAEALSVPVITNALTIDTDGKTITCKTRSEGTITFSLPAVVTVERINTLRLPSIRSKKNTVEVWNAGALGADKQRCGSLGSRTKVIKTSESDAGKRKCRFISRNELGDALEEAKNREIIGYSPINRKIPHVVTVGEHDFPDIGEVTTRIPIEEAERIGSIDCDMLLFGSDDRSKRVAAKLAWKYSLGLCADCTSFSYDGEKIHMIRPALSGSVIATIESLSRPCAATVRTAEESAGDIIVTAGFGAIHCLDKIKNFADSLGAELCASRKAVDGGYFPYPCQVGLTGRTVSPKIYIAVGVSGAVHHIAGMSRSGTVIAINPDRDAPIFEYADYGIVDNF